LWGYVGCDECFVDSETFERGLDFVRFFEGGIGPCEFLFVVIGPDWTSKPDASGRPRLQDPRDWVRIEVAAALKRKVRLIPTLVGGAHIPEEDQVPEDLTDLCHRQAHELSDTRWSYDVGVLLQTIEKAGVKALASRAQMTLRQKTKAVVAAVISCGLVLAVVLGIGSRLRPIDPPRPINLVRPPDTTWTADAGTPIKTEAERKVSERIERQLAQTR